MTPEPPPPGRSGGGDGGAETRGGSLCGDALIAGEAVAKGWLFLYNL